MNQFVSCKKIETGNCETILLNLDAVRSIRRYYRDERGDVVEDYKGNLYACYRPVFEGGKEVGYDEDFERCIITFDVCPAKTYYSVREVAEMLNVTKQTVGQWLRDDKLKGAKVGRDYRVTRKDLDAFMQGRERHHE